MRRIAGLVLAGVVAACGGGGGNSIDDLCAEDGLYADFFERTFECNPLASLILGELDPADVSALCYGALQPYLDDGTTELGGGDAFDACRDFIASASCDQLNGRGLDNPCEDLFEGTVPLGGVCENDLQCAGEAYCDQPSADTCGSCTALKDNTAACVDDGECLSERCDDTGQCADLVEVGGTCGSDNDCQGVLICNQTNLQCAEEPSWAVGSPCSEVFADCGFGETDLYCHQTTMQCAAFKEIGESCGASDGGTVCRIFDYQTCQETSTGSGVYQCVAATIVGVGQECGLAEGLKCETGLSCADHDSDSFTPEQCMVPLGENDACDPDNSLCDFLMNCVDGVCQYGDYTGLCPAPPDAP